MVQQGPRRTDDAYVPRLADRELRARLDSFGAVLIEGPKWCGKTTTAAQQAASELLIDDPRDDFAQRAFAQIDPAGALEGPEPRLIDEWQEVPKLWDGVRFLCDQRPGTGHFILTGSATPRDRDLPHHSGAGRIARLSMGTMTLYESGVSDGSMSVDGLFAGDVPKALQGNLSLADLATQIVRGGWPGTMEAPLEAAEALPIDYLSTIADIDVSEIDGVRRSPEKVMALLRSLARNESTLASQATLGADAGGLDKRTVTEYLGILRRLHVVEDVPAWSPTLLSRVPLRKSAKHHLVDPSLAAAGLGTSVGRLSKDMRALGFLFESLVLRDIRSYGRTLGARLYHYRDRTDLEVDAILQRRDGAWVAFEVKLGRSQVGEAVENLVKLREKLVRAGGTAPAALCVIVGFGGISRVTDEGVVVAPIDRLGP